MSKKISTEDFIQRARAVHGDTYDYSKVVYTGSKNKVTITCKEHGDFNTTPRIHLSGCKCPSCGKDELIKNSAESRTHSIDMFLQQARAVHGDTYNYSKTVYTKNTDKVTITCKEHGDFQQTPKEHKKGSGCSKCGVEKRRLSRRSTIDSFISNAHNIHGDKYSYHLVDYKGNKTKVDIVCPLHGVFSQRPNDHITGNGCPHCSVTGFDTRKQGVVYILKAVKFDIMKVGISNNLKHRMSKLNRETPFGFSIIATKEFTDGDDASKCERYLHSLCNSAGYKGFDGATEWFDLDFNILKELDNYE